MKVLSYSHQLKEVQRIGRYDRSFEGKQTSRDRLEHTGYNLELFPFAYLYIISKKFSSRCIKNKYLYKKQYQRTNIPEEIFTSKLKNRRRNKWPSFWTRLIACWSRNYKSCPWAKHESLWLACHFVKWFSVQCNVSR